MSDEERGVEPKTGVEKGLHDAGEEQDDPWPAEPAEFDPHSLGPSGDPASLDVDPVGTDVDRETFRAFWGAVVMVNVGLFCVAIGPMLVYFRDQVAVGGGLVLVGLVAFAQAYRTYRNYVDGEDEERDEDPDADGGRDPDDETVEGVGTP